jgi:hypothetical protein
MSVSPVPYSASESSRARLAELGMGDLLDDLARNGFAVIRNVADAAFVQLMREAILRVAAPGGPANFSRMAGAVLGLDPVFEEAVLKPKVQAAVEAVLGKGALISALQGSVRTEGPDFVPLHADQSWMPAPYPEQPYFFTLCWSADGFSKDSGATSAVPGSHRLRRYPTADDQREAEVVPIDCAAGDIACWLGSTWHGSFPRTLPGERVVLHMAFSRVSVRPIENYNHLDEAWLAGKPEALRIMLGREDFFGKAGGNGIGFNDGEYERKAKRTGLWAREDTFTIPG